VVLTNRIAWASLAVVLSFSLAGCQGLLPRASSESRDTWGSFDEARDAIDRIVPFETRRAQLATQGLEPGADPTITLLSFADVSQRFALGATVSADGLDQGLRDCFAAGKRCTAYAIAIRDVKRRRVGNFWLDTFNFERVTDSSGWTFNALIVFVDDLVVYTLTGGQPRISERDRVRNPLGPLQAWGDILAKHTLE
jgi:hypothetical protein